MDQVYVIRHKVLVEGVPVRRVAREMGVSRNTLRHYIAGVVHPGQRMAVGRTSPIKDRRGGQEGNSDSLRLGCT